MQYGYFDSKDREYVITKPNTPAPWANYLGSPEYGAIISNNAGGYSFVKSGANGRVLRYRFNQDDKPGRYIYLRDDETNDYWSASWQPVGKDLSAYKSECHHGTGYTSIQADYTGIHSEVLYYVPLNKTYEVWHCKITNTSDCVRKLSTFGFAEFTNHFEYENDLVNLQYSLFITRTYFEQNKIIQYVNENCCKTKVLDTGDIRFFGLANAVVESYNGDLTSFIGEYRDYSKPIAVEKGQCDNTLNYNSNSCGVLHTKIELKPGETKEFSFLLGAKDSKTADDIIVSYENPSVIEKEIEELKQYWHGKLEQFQVETPDATFNEMVNTWNAYQCFITFTWSRAASFTYCGLRNGYGYRDTVQDIQGIIHLDPEAALEKIRFMISAQTKNGGGLPLVKYTHEAAAEDTPDEASYRQETGHPSYRADDTLWLVPTVDKYIKETGNLSFLDEKILYANGGEDTVYDHLKRAIQFSMERVGYHNLPAGLYADWNDCLRLGELGESSFVAFQLYYGMVILEEYAKLKKDQSYIEYLETEKANLHQNIQKYCWEDDRFIRGYKEDGEVIGSKNNEEAKIWLNPQSWSVISTYATKEQADKVLNTAYEQLNTTYGARLMAPSYVSHAFAGARAILFNPSTKENAGIFSQSQGWIILAECINGNGNRAFEYFTETAPSAQNEHAEIRIIEPYVHGQFTESIESPFEGRSHVHWLTGTASTMMVACVEGICGMKPEVDGLTVAPCIPEGWKKFKIHKNFRGKQLHITIQNESGVQFGYKKCYLNGVLLENNFIKVEDMKESNEIVLIM